MASESYGTGGDQRNEDTPSVDDQVNGGGHRKVKKHKKSKKKSKKRKHKNSNGSIDDRSTHDDSINSASDHSQSPKKSSKESGNDGIDASSLQQPVGADSRILEQAPVKSDKETLQWTHSLIQSLPISEAEPETTRIGSILAYTAEVEPITDSGRLPAGEMNHVAEDEDQRRPSLISVRINKPTEEVKLGVGFRSVFGELLVGNIAPTSPLANTQIRRDDRLISLDDHQNTRHWTGVQAANYIRSKVGLICLVVRTKNGDPNLAEATTFKSSAKEMVGISFKSDNGRLRISNIHSYGLLGVMAVLQPGDYLETINNMHVAYVEPSLALQIVRASVGTITFRVKHTDTTELSVRDVVLTDYSSRRFSGGMVTMADELTTFDLESGLMSAENSEFQIRPGFISVKLYKPTVDTIVGISFMNPEGDQLQIRSISSPGMLAKSPLASGHRIQSIGNIRCRRWSKHQALQYIRSAVGELLLIVHDPVGDPAYAVAMAHKPTSRAKLGISFRTSGGPLRIGNIQPDGILCNSVLNCDDAVISINNIPCEHLTPGEAVSITQRNPESVTLLVKPHRNNGIVLSHITDMINGDEYELALQRRQNVPNHSGQSRSSSAGYAICCVVVGIVLLVVLVNRANRCDPNEYPYDCE